MQTTDKIRGFSRHGNKARGYILLPWDLAAAVAADAKRLGVSVNEVMARAVAARFPEAKRPQPVKEND